MVKVVTVNCAGGKVYGCHVMLFSSCNGSLPMFTAWKNRTPKVLEANLNVADGPDCFSWFDYS